MMSPFGRGRPSSWVWRSRFSAGEIELSGQEAGLPDLDAVVGGLRAGRRQAGRRNGDDQRQTASNPGRRRAQQ
jgi:hypothetical protein